MRVRIKKCIRRQYFLDGGLDHCASYTAFLGVLVRISVACHHARILRVYVLCVCLCVCVCVQVFFLGKLVENFVRQMYSVLKCYNSSFVF